MTTKSTLPKSVLFVVNKDRNYLFFNASISCF